MKNLFLLLVLLAGGNLAVAGEYTPLYSGDSATIGDHKVECFERPIWVCGCFDGERERGTIESLYGIKEEKGAAARCAEKFGGASALYEKHLNSGLACGFR